MYPTINLQPGQRGPEVEQLQNFLMTQGFLTQEEINTGPGIYGPRTTRAVQSWQEANGVDNTSGPGYWGPRSIGVASGTSSSGTEGETGGTKKYADQPYSNEEYTQGALDNPYVNQAIERGNTIEDLEYASSTGDLSGLVNQFGQPFSDEDQQKALADSMEDNRLYYEALQQKAEADTESALAQKKADYQDYLLRSGQEFEQDKLKYDQSAADRGVLFSGGRVQKERQLERAYNQDQASKLASTGRQIGNTARDYQYEYGNDAANNLSQYYKLGSNTFDANKATGGVDSGSLSNIYNPDQVNFQGTKKVSRLANANRRAAGKLWNKGNKLLASGYNNQY